MSTNSKHRPSAFGVSDKVTVKAATKEQKKEIRELAEEGKFDDEDIEKLSEESATYILIYERSLKESREHVEELEERLEAANQAADEAKDKVNSLQDTIYSKDSDIERLVKKITDIRIEQAEEMNSIIMRFKSLQEKEIENRQKLALKNRLQLEQASFSKNSPSPKKQQGQERKRTNTIWGLFKAGVSSHVEMVKGKSKQPARGRGRARGRGQGTGQRGRPQSQTVMGAHSQNVYKNALEEEIEQIDKPLEDQQEDGKDIETLEEEEEKGTD